MLWELLKLSLPAGVAVLLLNVSNLMTSMFVGRRLGPESMAHFATAQTAYNVGALTVGVGLVGALDTFVPQTFGRNPDSAEIGEWLQRGIVVIVCVCAPCWAFFFFSESVLSCVFHADLARGAAQFLTNAYLCLLSQLLAWAQMSTINGVRQTFIPLVAFAASSVWCLLLNYLFLDSVASAAWVLFGASLMNNLIMAGFCWRHPSLAPIRKASWPIAPHLFELAKFRQFFVIGLPTMVAVCAEWWAWDALVIIAAQLSDEAVVVLQIAIGILYIFFLFTSSFSRGATISVGNALGANNPELAKRSAEAAVGAVFISQAFCAALIFLSGDKLWRLWTVDPQILQFAYTARPWLALSAIVDGVQFTIQGIYRGAGRPEEAAPRVLGSVWGVGLVAAYLFTMKLDFGPVGTLVGVVVGAIVEIPLLAWNVRSWNWSQLALVASKRHAELDSGALPLPVPRSADAAQIPCAEPHTVLVV